MAAVPFSVSFASKVAIVTGGARGIGLACARALCNRGASVVLADADLETASKAAMEMNTQQNKVLAFACDVSSTAEVEKLVQFTVEKLGGVDIVISNAGIVRAAPFLEMTEKDFDDVINVNLKGVFLTGQHAARQMVKQGRGGAIINMGSVNGVTAIPTIAGYNASKGGVHNLTRSMALALAPHGIRVNAIAPGSIMTDVLRKVADNPEEMNKVLSRVPLGRVGEPEEVGEIAAFLASDSASYIVGETIYADGGRLALNYTVPVQNPPPKPPAMPQP